MTELLLVVIPCLLLVDVQIKRDAKLLVMAVFAVRLPDIIFSALNLNSLNFDYSRSNDVGLALVYPLIWTQTELLWSIIAASVPCLKTFMRPFDNIDEDTWRSNNDMYASGGKSHRSWHDPRDKDGAVPLEEIKGHKHGMIMSSTNNRAMDVRPDNFGHDVSISHSGMALTTDEEHRRSWGSEDHIIKAQTHWEVRSERNTRDPYAIP